MHKRDHFIIYALPTGNLDADTAQEIMNIFARLAHEEGKCVIVVTHSQEFAEVADAVVRLEGKKLVTMK